MRKALITIVLVFGIFFVPCKAQELSLGGGLSYGSGINNPGINVRGDVRFYEVWSVSPNFNYFFNRRSSDVIREWKDLSIDGHLYFKMNRRWNIYPLFGINFATVSEKEDNLTYSNSDVGLNLGGGSEIKIDPRLFGFGELKYVTGNADQAVLTFGLIYRITQ